MGGSQSKPQPQVVVKDAPYPSPSNRKSGISISESSECGRCDLRFQANISSSTARLTREFGGVKADNCAPRYQKDWDDMWVGKLSVRDFVGRVQSGNYLLPVPDSPGYCAEVRFSDEDAAAMKTVNDVYNKRDSLQRGRVRQVTNEGFSKDSKIILRPSIPLKASFNGTSVDISTITVYHPAPLRVQDQQADAVISLNDPSVSGPNTIILVPVVSGDSSTSSAKFFSRIASQFANVVEPDHATGQYRSVDVQTGKDWGLAQLFSAEATKQGDVAVNAGYFSWTATGELERYLKTDQPLLKEYDWRPKAGSQPIRYIMLEKPVPIGASDLASLVNTVPVTPWEEAIHPVTSAVVYKKGPPGSSCGAVREHMTTQTSDLTNSCDPFTRNAASVPAYIDDSYILKVVLWIFTAIAALVGAYIALAAVARMYDVEYAEFAKGAGKVMGVWAKSMREKVNKIRNAVSSARGLASGKIPGLPAGLPAGLPKPPAALADILPVKPPENIQALATPAALKDILPENPPKLPATPKLPDILKPIAPEEPPASLKSMVNMDIFKEPADEIRAAVNPGTTRRRLPAVSPPPVPERATRRVSELRKKYENASKAISPEGQGLKTTIGRGRSV